MNVGRRESLKKQTWGARRKSLIVRGSEMERGDVEGKKDKIFPVHPE